MSGREVRKSYVERPTMTRLASVICADLGVGLATSQVNTHEAAGQVRQSFYPAAFTSSHIRS